MMKFKLPKMTLKSLAIEKVDDIRPLPYRSLEEGETPVKFDKPADRETLENRILTLWKTVWLGLYHSHDKDGGSHEKRLRMLYMGTGMAQFMPSGYDDYTLSSSCLGFHHVGLGLLGKALRKDPYFLGPGIGTFKLYKGLSLKTLQAVVDLLESYEREIAPLREVYDFLRERQIGLRQPTLRDQKDILKGYPLRAEPIATRLMNYDARLSVLMMDMCDEARVIHGNSEASKGWRVADRISFRSIT